MKKPLALLCVSAIAITALPNAAISGNAPLPPEKPMLHKASTKAAAPQTETKTPFAVSRKDDLTLGCAQLRQETAAMRMIITDKERVKNASKMQSRGISAAGAVGSLLVGTVTGGIGLAAAGLMLDHNVSEKKEDADHEQDIAEQRRTWLKGLYAAQDCEGPIETPNQAAEAEERSAENTLAEDLSALKTASGEPEKTQDAKDDSARTLKPYQATLNKRYND